MKLAQETTVIRKTFAVLAGLSILCAAAPRASARRHDAIPTPQPSIVLAHLQIPGASVNQLILNAQGAKQYLYLDQGSNEGLTVVDVTKPSQPTVVKRKAGPKEASTRELRMIGHQLALVDSQSSAASDPEPHSSTFMLLDLSDPASPRTIQTFPGVTSTLTDGARSLTYIADRDGLWIVRSPETTAAAELPECASGDASNDVASCR